MQVTTGIDIIEVNRIQEAIEKLGTTFLEKIYTEAEIAYCNRSQGNMAYQHFAGRFAAKEAVFKAISTYVQNSQDTMWKTIEIVDNPQGKPAVNVDKLRKIGLTTLQNIDISISHIKEYAVASVVAVFE